ncbi:alpha/beta hydrolase, partial [Rhizobiaceae sp. 2RAB30]
MPSIRRFACLLAASFSAIFLALNARAAELAPYKDQLFAYPAILSQADGGDYVVVDYNEARDINARDEVPERRVKGDYVALRVRGVQKDLVLSTPAGEVKHVAIGRREGAEIITIYLHGQG